MEEVRVQVQALGVPPILNYCQYWAPGLRGGDLPTLTLSTPSLRDRLSHTGPKDGLQMPKTPKNLRGSRKSTNDRRKLEGGDEMSKRPEASACGLRGPAIGGLRFLGGLPENTIEKPVWLLIRILREKRSPSARMPGRSPSSGPKAHSTSTRDVVPPKHSHPEAPLPTPHPRPEPRHWRQNLQG